MPVLVCSKQVRCSAAFSLKISDFLFKKCTVSPEKTGFFPKQNKSRCWSASLTVEAAMALPLFFFTFFLLWQFFLLLFVQLTVFREITEVTLTRGGLGYVEREADEEAVSLIYEPLIWNALAGQERVENLRVSFEEAEERIQGRVSYEFVCEAVFFPAFRIPVIQTFCFRPYSGEYDADRFAAETEADGTLGEVVYVTEHGTVYHESKTCVYLSVRVTGVAYGLVGEKRNSSGRKYTACSRCAASEEPEQVYISSSGTKYHINMECPALKRAVQEKKREEVRLPACSKCGKVDE